MQSFQKPPESQYSWLSKTLGSISNWCLGTKRAYRKDCEKDKNILRWCRRQMSSEPLPKSAFAKGVPHEALTPTSPQPQIPSYSASSTISPSGQRRCTQKNNCIISHACSILDPFTRAYKDRLCRPCRPRNSHMAGYKCIQPLEDSEDVFWQQGLLILPPFSIIPEINCRGF